MPTRLVLYRTDACHLCEQALAAVQPLLGAELVLEQVDIADSDELMARYGMIIPVLRNEAAGRELNWPFDTAAVRQLLTGNC